MYVRKEEINRLNAFEMWVWRRMGKVSWMDKRTNEQVLSSMNEKRSLIKTIWDRKKNWIGHVVKGDGLMKLVLEGRMEGKRPRERPRMGMIDDVLDATYGDLKRKAENREAHHQPLFPLPHSLRLPSSSSQHILRTAGEIAGILVYSSSDYTR